MHEHRVRRHGGDGGVVPRVQPVLHEVGVHEAVGMLLPDVEMARVAQEEMGGDVRR